VGPQAEILMFRSIKVRGGGQKVVTTKAETRVLAQERPSL
jgi:hypothetical protein